MCVCIKLQIRIDNKPGTINYCSPFFAIVVVILLHNIRELLSAAHNFQQETYVLKCSDETFVSNLCTKLCNKALFLCRQSKSLQYKWRLFALYKSIGAAADYASSDAVDENTERERKEEALVQTHVEKITENL